MAAVEEPNIKVGRYSEEERKERILRYLKKRNQRNFNKTIKVFLLSHTINFFWYNYMIQALLLSRSIGARYNFYVHVILNPRLFHKHSLC